MISEFGNLDELAGELGIEENGGSIDIKSEPKKGTEVIIKVPLKKKDLDDFMNKKNKLICSTILLTLLAGCKQNVSSSDNINSTSSTISSSTNNVSISSSISSSVVSTIISSSKVESTSTSTISSSIIK